MVRKRECLPRVRGLQSRHAMLGTFKIHAGDGFVIGTEHQCLPDKLPLKTMMCNAVIFFFAFGALGALAGPVQPSPAARSAFERGEKALEAQKRRRGSGVPGGAQGHAQLRPRAQRPGQRLLQAEEGG